MVRKLPLAVTAVAALLASVVPALASDTGHTPDGKPRPDLYGNTVNWNDMSLRQTVWIGRPIQYLNPGNMVRLHRPSDRAPYALSGNEPRRSAVRTQTIQVGSRQVLFAPVAK